MLNLEFARTATTQETQAQEYRNEVQAKKRKFKPDPEVFYSSIKTNSRKLETAGLRICSQSYVQLDFRKCDSPSINTNQLLHFSNRKFVRLKTTYSARGGSSLDRRQSGLGQYSRRCVKDEASACCPTLRPPGAQPGYDQNPTITPYFE